MESLNTKQEFKIKLIDKQNNKMDLSGNFDDPDLWHEMNEHYISMFTSDVKLEYTDDYKHIYSIYNIDNYEMMFMSLDGKDKLSEKISLSNLLNTITDCEECIDMYIGMTKQIVKLDIFGCDVEIIQHTHRDNKYIQIIF